MTDFDTDQKIRALAAMHVTSFDDWVRAKPVEDNFGEVPWLDIVTSASLALIALDKNTKSLEGVIDRLSRLYRWIVKKQPADKAAAPVTLPEHIIVLLADERAQHGEGLTPEELEARTMTPAAKVLAELTRLRSLSIVVESDGRWTLRIAPD